MNVVVTGSEGFLGRRVVARLSAEGYSVLAVDRIAHGTESPPGVVHHQSDLSDPPSLMPSTPFAAGEFTLIHIAWDMRRFEGYALQADQIRQLAAMLDYWGARGLRSLIAMGSAEEYGPTPGRLSESSAPSFPLSAYGWAKRSSRDLAQSWSIRSGIPVTWLRPFIMYGPGQRGDMLIPSAIEAARQKVKTPFTDGRQRRDFVFVDDVVEAIVLCLRKQLKGYREFNLGRGEEIPVADVLMAIARRYHAESLFDLGARPRRPGEPDVQVADTSCARELLGWQAAVDCDEGIRRIIGDDAT